MKCFHCKRRLLRHLSGQKEKTCIGLLSSNFRPNFFVASKAKYGKGATSRAVHRAGPPRDEDRRPVEQCYGPMLDVGSLPPVAGPGGVYFSLADLPEVGVAERQVWQDYRYLVEGTLVALFVTRDFFVLNLFSDHCRPGDMIDLASRLSPAAGFCVWLMSIDIVSGNPEHNLANDECVQRILGHIAG